MLDDEEEDTCPVLFLAPGAITDLYIARKKKIMSYIKSLDIPKAKKYMLMGYLGYKNTSGGKDVMEYINGLDLSRAEEYMLYGLSGYNASGGKKEVWNYINNLNMDRENKQKLWKACGF